MTGSAIQIPSIADWSALGVETTLAVTLVALLVTPFLSRSGRAVGGVGLAGVVLALLVTLLPSPSAGHSAFFGMVIADPAALLWKQVLLLFTAGVICIWFGATRRAVPAGDVPEFMTLLVSSTLGLSLMGATSNLLLILLALELASMPSYVLAGFRKTRRHAAEAALKYVLFGAVCTAVTVYGLSLLYGSAGTLDLTRWLVESRGAYSPVAIVGVLFVLVGLLFKISAVPAHFWTPDVFEGSHVDVAAFLSVASKGAGLMLLARLWAATAGLGTPTVAGMAAVLALVAVATTTVGNLGALRQSSVKRILAYSSIAHAGYMLCALAILPGGRTSLITYLIVYAVMNLGAFAVLAGVERVAGSDDVSAFDGLIIRSPVAAVAMAICLVSMVGLPPAAGVLVKWKIMVALASAGGAWWWVVASVGVNSVISLVYYAKILRAMFLRPPATAEKPGVLIVGLAGASAVLLVAMLIAFAPLERWAAGATFWLPPSQTP